MEREEIWLKRLEDADARTQRVKDELTAALLKEGEAFRAGEKAVAALMKKCDALREQLNEAQAREKYWRGVREGMTKDGDKLRCWQHKDTGRMVELPIGKNPGPRWYQIGEKAKELFESIFLKAAGEGHHQPLVLPDNEIFPYILKADRDKPPEEQTVFYFRSMTSEELKGKIIEKSEEILREADLEAAFKEGVQSTFEHQGWDEGPYIEDAQLLWEESEIRKRHREGPILIGPIESVPGMPIQETPEQKEFREKVATEVTEAVVQDVMDASYEPERVKVPVKFESGTWPVGLDNLLKALRSSFAVNPNDSAYDKNLGEALAQFDGPPSTTELLETLPGVEVTEEIEVVPIDCLCGDPTCLGCGEKDDADEDFGIPSEEEEGSDG